jgi:CRP-like cAMP-binding protein
VDNVNVTASNWILASIEPATHSRLAPHLQPVPVTPGEVIHKAGDVPRYVYFPLDCIVGLEQVDSAGKATGVAIVGNDGLVGLSSFLGAAASPSRALGQVSGFALRMDAAMLKAEFDRDERLRERLLRYALALMTQMAQTAFCYRHHSVLQQVCRWMLMSLDRLPQQSIKVTHEHVAQALGVRREGVTEAVGKLERAGIIQHRRGYLQVVERTLLERSSCECYAAIAGEYARLVPGRSAISAPSTDSLKPA